MRFFIEEHRMGRAPIEHFLLGMDTIREAKQEMAYLARARKTDCIPCVLVLRDTTRPTMMRGSTVVAEKIVEPTAVDLWIKQIKKGAKS